MTGLETLAGARSSTGGEPVVEEGEGRARLETTSGARIVVVSAGLRSPSTTRLLADDLAQQVVAALGPDTQVEHVELRDHAHALADALLTGFPTGALADAVEAVGRADGLIVVTPTFSASYSGLFKSFFDILEPGTLADVPVLLAATGGTERHSLVLEHALRPLFVYLGAAPVRTGVYAATSDFGGAGVAALQTRIARAADELAGAVQGAGKGTARRTMSADLAAGPEDLDGGGTVVPFEQLLRG